MTFHARPGDFDVATWTDELPEASLPERLRLIRENLPGRLVFTTSFGLEDQALTHAIADAQVDVALVTLDTGRLFDETLELWAETEILYGVAIRAYVPEDRAVERLLTAYGPLGFRRSIDARQACCGVRKVEPLGRALAGAAGWITGLRADQSATRAATPFAVQDPERALLKISPLADWSRADVAAYVARNGVPYNPLHDQGYRSIGCAPCTRAVMEGEDERAGRWWWEQDAKRECGLHDRPAAPAAPATRLPVSEPIPALG